MVLLQRVRRGHSAFIVFTAAQSTAGRMKAYTESLPPSSQEKDYGGKRKDLDYGREAYGCHLWKIHYKRQKKQMIFCEIR